MKKEPLILACCSDIAGKVRGKAFPASDLEKRVRRGIGWTPTNVQITCFDIIAESPYGSFGDLLLIPDLQTQVCADFADGLPSEQFVIGDIVETTGEPWACCTRSILKSALQRLEDVAGLKLIAAFEHEFHLLGANCPIGSAYTASGFRIQRPFAETLIALMRDAGLEPDTVMKEYGVDQYEVTMGPATGVAAADHAVMLRELVRIVGERLGKPASFTPLRDPAGVGNGVHIHMSFRDQNDQPMTYDAQGKHGLSEFTGRFIAGVLKYLDRIVALTAPSVVSYTRLTPHRWSAAFNNLGFRDREASMRICPISDVSDVAKATQYNIEFRAADAAASPYLALAAIINAGVQGIDEGLDCPDATEEDLALLSADELSKRNLVRLPQSLDDAIQRFADDPQVKSWFPGEFAHIYTLHKQGEMAFLKGKSEADICALYEAAY